MTVPRIESDILPQFVYRLGLMYRYAKQLNNSVASGRVTRESLGSSYYDQAAVTKLIELVGENAWQIRKLNVDLGHGIDLMAIASMRHRMVHHYEGIDWSFVEEAAFEDIPQLVLQIEDVAIDLGIDLPQVEDER